MEAWKRRAYDSYRSSGMTQAIVARPSGRPSRTYPYVARLVRRHVPAPRDVAVADLACGGGALLSCLKEFGYRNIRGVDTSPEQVAAARASGLMEIECATIEHYLVGKEEHFDVIFMLDILEHCPKGELLQVLDDVRSALRPGGTLILHVPNAEGLFGMRVRYGDITHENAFTPQSIGQTLRLCGFDDVRCFEDKPIVRGPISLGRYLLWVSLTAPFRLLLSAETGGTRHILSQNMAVVARKSPKPDVSTS